MSAPRVVVAGGTGNVGTFIVQTLLERGATVVVPSRSEKALAEFRTHLVNHVGRRSMERLQTIVANVADENQRIDFGTPDAVVASLGSFVAADSLLGAPVEALNEAMRSYIRAHFVVAQRFLPGLIARGGTYVFINGPLAFDPVKGWGSGIVSTVTAAQHMLFRALAQETDHTNVRIAELVNYAFIRGRRTQPGSTISGDATGMFVAELLFEPERDIHGQSIHLKTAPALVY